ncbi:hypothetical protein BJ138DRAFT_990150, partial [Hygrophoropsis aurantiaca]
LASLPWSGNIRGFDNPEPIHRLATYATRGWLGTTHEDQMLDLLRRDLHRGSTSHKTVIENLAFSKFLQEGYARRNSGEYEASRYFRVARGLGQALASQTRDILGYLMNLNDNHWVVVVLNFRDSTILYGDSLGDPIPANLASILDWWTNTHTGLTFVHKTLPITHQQDSFSCGLLSFNALAHYILPDQYPLINPVEVDNERLKIMLQVVKRHSEQ